MSAIAQLKAMVGLDASAYKAGAQTVVGENARMTGSMRGAAGSIGQSSQVIKKNVMEVARASQGARSAFIGVSQAMSGNFAGAAASAATAKDCPVELAILNKSLENLANSVSVALKIT